jgi:RNA polymerase sigma factor (sigma-70 family)
VNAVTIPRAPRKQSAELDPETLDQCRLGRPQAFRKLVACYERQLVHFISRFSGPGPHVEDLAQETFLRVYKALRGFDPKGAAALSTWILTIATRLCLDKLARRFDDECAEHRERFKGVRERIAMVLDPQAQARREAELRDSDDADAVAAHGRFLIGQGQWQAASEWARAALEHETFSDEARCDLRLSLSYAEGKRMGPQAAEGLLTEFRSRLPRRGEQQMAPDAPSHDRRAIRARMRAVGVTKLEEMVTALAIGAVE